MQRSADQGPWWSNFTVGSLGLDTNSPSVVISNGTLHSVFVNSGVYYSRSLDSGKTWSSEKMLSDPGTTGAWTPSIFANGSEIFVVWNQESGGVQTHKIYYTKSNDSGISFTKAILLTGVNAHWSTDQKIVQHGDQVYVVWADDRDDPSRANQELYIKRSDDRGLTWGTDTRFTYASWPSWHPWIGVLGDTIHIVWEDERLGGTHRIYYKKSIDKGASWTPDLMISAPSIDVIEPSFSMVGQNLYVVWSKEPYDLQYRTSTDGGNSWDIIRTIIGGDTVGRHEPFIKAFGNYIQVTWNQNGDLGYMNSTNGGISFGSDVLLGTNLELVSNRGGLQVFDCDINGSYVVYSHNNSEILYRYKGYLPDLSVSSADVTFSNPYGYNGTTYVDLNAKIHNLGKRDASNYSIEFFLDNFTTAGLFSTITSGHIKANDVQEININLTPKNLSSNIRIIIKNSKPYDPVTVNNQVTVALNILKFFPSIQFSVRTSPIFDGRLMQFDLNKTYDPDNVITKFNLIYGDGNSTDWRDFQNNVTYEHHYRYYGIFIASLWIQNWYSDINEFSNITIVINSKPPFPFFGYKSNEEQIFSKSPIFFNASASIDPDGFIVSYNWTFGDGTNGSGKTINHTYSTPGEYSVCLMIIDNAGMTAQDCHTIRVLHRPPIAVITILSGNGTYMKDELVNFSAIDSLAPETKIVSASWDFDDGTIRTAFNVSHKFNKMGDYDVELMVTDDQGIFNITKVIIHILNQLPTVNAEANQTSVYCLDIIQFNSTALDKDGKITKYLWEFGDGKTSNQTNPEHSYLIPGNYTVTFTVEDDDEAKVNMTLEIRVINRSPVVVSWANNTLVYIDDMILFSGWGSRDLDGQIASYVWNFSDGKTISEMNCTHSFHLPGVYNVKLTVTDDLGAISVAQLKIQVMPRPETHGNDNDQNIQWKYLGLGAGLIIIIVVMVVYYLFRKKPSPLSEGQKDDKPKTDHNDPKGNKSGNKVRKERAVEDGPDESSEDDEKST